MTFKVTLPNGMLVTNPEQFTDEREEYETELLERYHDIQTLKRGKSILVDILIAIYKVF